MYATWKKLGWITFVALVAAASVRAAFPDAATAEKIFLAEISERYGEPEGVTTSAFVEGETSGQALAAVRVAYGYYTEVYVALFVQNGRGWRVADFDGPINYMPEFGGDEGTVAWARFGPWYYSPTRLEPWTYYIFTCTEASYGSGMGTEYDYFVLYRVDGEKLVKAFEGETGSREDYYSRWYGGDDSSAWEYGAYVERTTEFAFDDTDGDGALELWAFTRERPAKDGPWTYVDAALYTPDDSGNLAAADVGRFREFLERDDSPTVKLLLAGAALLDEGDVGAALEYLTQAAADYPSLEPAVERRREFLRRLKGDPAEAIRLFYAGGSDEHRALIDRYPESAAAAEATIQMGTSDELRAFLKKNRNHPRWPEAYAYAVREALYDVNYEESGGLSKKELGRLKKDLKRYRKLAVDAEERAQTLTHLADCFYHLGEFKTAARLYEDSLAEFPQGVFEGYDYLRLGDCAAAAGDHGAAIAYYMECAGLVDWWSDDADDALIGYAAIREGGKRRHFLDYLDERGGYGYLTLETGDLDGTGNADVVALVQRDGEPDELYYFLRKGDEFVGESLTRGRPSLWLVEGREVFDVGPALLSCRETVDAEGGRAAYEVLYRYDGSSMREVGRVKTEETRDGEPAYEYKATLAFADAPRPILTVEGTFKTDESETTFAEEYVWDDESFAFVRRKP
jgi:tetratricopeptide (TPR) repeat protein